MVRNDAESFPSIRKNPKSVLSQDQSAGITKSVAMFFQINLFIMKKPVSDKTTRFTLAQWDNNLNR